MAFLRRRDEKERRGLNTVIALQQHLAWARRLDEESEELEDRLRRMRSLAEAEEQAGKRVRRYEQEADARQAVYTPFTSTEPSPSQRAEEHIQARLFGQQLKKIIPLLPTIGPGYSVANQEASRKRRALVHPYPGGVYGAFQAMTHVGGSDGFRQKTGFSKAEFDQFYADQGGDRGHLFAQSRNHYGGYTEEENAGRRKIRGRLSDCDRVLCWLQMLRKGTQFDEMEAQYGPSRGTFSHDFQWMTISAQDMPCLREEIKWPTAQEREKEADFLRSVFHPELDGCVYITDRTKVGMRNPSKVETVNGCLSDRAAHCNSNLFLEPDDILAEAERGIGDGVYRGTAKTDNALVHMATPHRGHLTTEQKHFNSMQRRLRVVVENTIGQIKKWKVIGGDGNFQHRRDFEPPVFEVCAKLTARIMRVRNKYPRSDDWCLDQLYDWEAKLGVYLWMDPEEPGSYLIHNRGEDLVDATNTIGDAAPLQKRWEEIFSIDEF